MSEPVANEWRRSRARVLVLAVILLGACSDSAAPGADANNVAADGGVAGARRPCTDDGACGADRCVDGFCLAGSGPSGTKDGTETDVDCGGASAPPCPE